MNSCQGLNCVWKNVGIIQSVLFPQANDPYVRGKKYSVQEEKVSVVRCLFQFSSLIGLPENVVASFLFYFIVWDKFFHYEWIMRLSAFVITFPFFLDFNSLFDSTCAEVKSKKHVFLGTGWICCLEGFYCTGSGWGFLYRIFSLPFARTKPSKFIGEGFSAPTPAFFCLFI